MLTLPTRSLSPNVFHYHRLYAACLLVAGADTTCSKDSNMKARMTLSCGQHRTRCTEATITEPRSPHLRYSSNFKACSSLTGTPSLSYPNSEQTLSYASALSSGNIMSSLPSFNSMRDLQVVSPHGSCHQNYNATATESISAPPML